MNWHSVLNKYGVDVPHTEQFNILCPFHDDNRQSCSINIEQGVWICFAGCGQGSLKSFIWKLSGKSWSEIQEEFEVPDLGFDFDFNSFAEDSIENGEKDLPSYDGELTPIKSDHWIFKRGFTIETLERWNCRENIYRDLVIPVENKETTLGWITRRIQATPKYLFSKGFQKSKTLFGLKYLGDVNTLFVVEGALDAMWLDQHGYPSVAVLGASVSQTQIDLIGTYNPSEVVLCLDSDEAGIKGIRKATIDMNNRFMLSYIKFPKRYKDFQEIRNPKDLYKIIQNKNIW